MIGRNPCRDRREQIINHFQFLVRDLKSRGFFCRGGGARSRFGRGGCNIFGRNSIRPCRLMRNTHGTLPLTFGGIACRGIPNIKVTFGLFKFMIDNDRTIAQDEEN